MVKKKKAVKKQVKAVKKAVKPAKAKSYKPAFKSCSECGSLNIINNIKKNQIICRDCGAIFEPLTPEKEKKFERVRKEFL